MARPCVSAPDLAPLHRALAECRVDAAHIPGVAEILTRPPLSIGRSACDDPGPAATIQLGHGNQGKFAKPDRTFDADGAALLLWTEEGCHDLPPTWKRLSRNARKRARTLWGWFGGNHGLSVTPQGRPPIIDAALVLYCSRVLCEATGRCQFPRLRVDGTPGGPMGRALSEALPLAQSFLARRYPGYGTHAIDRRIDEDKQDNRKINERTKSIAEIIRVIRSKPFDDLCKAWRLGVTAADVAAGPGAFRLAIASSRPRGPSRAT
jgi:hypothetical protein